ncbi:MAG TPA: response regulator [candidate division Zixibacteria bacterium]|nr:response regulator [candidate division Zixibacteria bacterium]
MVDDNKDLVEFLRRLLSHHGFDVRCAFSGAECLEAVRREPVDLIVLDVMMPKTDGLQVCAELKRTAPSIPVMLLTARDDLATRAAAMSLGASEFVAKPINVADFLARVGTQLEMRGWQKTIDAAFARTKGDDTPAGK